MDGDRLVEDVKRNISRQIAFDAVMRVRTSTGIRPVNFYGHMHMTTTTDIELASINADKVSILQCRGILFLEPVKGTCQE